MAQTERKHKGSLTLGKLELALEAHEQLFGDVVKLEAVGDYTVATYDDVDYPAVASLLLLPMIGDAAPPTPNGATHLFNGVAYSLGQKLNISAFRTT